MYLAIIIAAIIVSAIGFIAFPFFLKWLAEENIFFTTVKEGTVKAIMRGKEHERFIMAFADHHLNDPTKRFDKNFSKWDVLYHGKKKAGDEYAQGESDDRYDDRPPWLKGLGLYWVGWPWVNSVYVYSFEWNEVRTEKETGKEKILPRAEATDFIFVSDFTYAVLAEEAETKDRLPADILTLVTVAIRNPYRALFSGEDWMQRVTAAINRHVRTFVGERTFEDLISKDELREFSSPIINLSTILPDDVPGHPPTGLKGKYGVRIRTADLQTIELSGGAQRQHQEATTRQYVAEQEAKATTLAGEAKANVIQKIGEAEAEALRKRLEIIAKHGESGITLAGYDAIRDSSKGPGNTIIWANNPLNSLTADMLKSATGGGKS